MEHLRDALEQAKAGNLDGFASLVERFQDMAVGYSYSILGDFHLAEDAAQEAFLEAYPNLHKVYGPEAFPSWFKRIVFKHCDRVLRRKTLAAAQLEDADQVAGSDGNRSRLPRGASSKPRYAQPSNPCPQPLVRQSPSSISRATPSARSANSWAFQPQH